MTNSTRERRLRRAAGIALLLATGYGCGGDTPEADTPGASAPERGDTPVVDSTQPGGPAVTVDPSGAPTSETDDPASPWTVQDTRVDRTGAGLAALTDVRSARHDGFDRVVLEFGDATVPGYSVAYIDRPVRQCGSGHTVPIDGDGWLQIEVTPAQAHTDAGQPTITERSRRPGLPNLLHLELTCDFEGHVVWVAGVGSPAPYRVFELTAPARLIVDVSHSNY